MPKWRPTALPNPPLNSLAENGKTRLSKYEKRVRHAEPTFHRSVGRRMKGVRHSPRITFRICYNESIDQGRKVLPAKIRHSKGGVQKHLKRGDHQLIDLDRRLSKESDPRLLVTSRHLLSSGLIPLDHSGHDPQRALFSASRHHPLGLLKNPAIRHTLKHGHTVAQRQRY